MPQQYWRHTRFGSTTQTARQVMTAVNSQNFKATRSISALILREMSTTYGRSTGGYVWAILEPIGAIVVLSIAFSLLLRAPSLGTSFPLFYATAYLPLQYFNSTANKVGRAIRFSKLLLTYPRVGWMDPILARWILNTLTQVMVTYLVLMGIVYIEDIKTLLDFPSLLVAFALAAFLGLGVGSLNTVLFGLFPAWEQIWGILSRPLILASGLFYIYEDLPTTAQDLLWWNPLIHISGIFRAGIYATYNANYSSVTYVCTFSGVATVLGLLFVRKFFREIINF